MRYYLITDGRNEYYVFFTEDGAASPFMQVNSRATDAVSAYGYRDNRRSVRLMDEARPQHPFAGAALSCRGITSAIPMLHAVSCPPPVILRERPRETLTSQDTRARPKDLVDGRAALSDGTASHEEPPARQAAPCRARFSVGAKAPREGRDRAAPPSE